MVVASATAYTYVNVGMSLPEPTRDATAYTYVNVSIPPYALDPAPGDTEANFVPLCGDVSFWPANDKAKVVIPVSEGERSDSAVLLPDGRVLYVFVKGGDIKQGYAPDVDTFLDEDGSVTDITTFSSNHNEPNATAFHDPGGKLFLITTSLTGPVHGTHLWVSPSGLGGDWKYRSAVQGPTNATGGNWFNTETNNKAISTPTFVGTRWVIHAPDYGVANDLVNSADGIFISEDEGFSWERRLSVSLKHASVGAHVGSVGGNRNLGMFDGRMYFYANQENTVADTDEIYYSDDGGIVWTQGADDGTSSADYNFPLRDAEYFYRIGASGEVWRNSAPGTGFDGTWELFREYPMGASRGSIFQPLGPNHIVYMHDGKVLGFKCILGWRILHHILT